MQIFFISQVFPAGHKMSPACLRLHLSSTGATTRCQCIKVRRVTVTPSWPESGYERTGSHLLCPSFLLVYFLSPELFLLSTSLTLSSYHDICLSLLVLMNQTLLLFFWWYAETRNYFSLVCTWESDVNFPWFTVAPSLFVVFIMGEVLWWQYSVLRRKCTDPKSRTRR